MQHDIVDIPRCRQVVGYDQQHLYGLLKDKSTCHRIRLSINGQVEQRVELPRSALFASTPQDIAALPSAGSEKQWLFANDELICLDPNGNVVLQIRLASLPLSLPANEKNEIGEVLATTDALYLSINHSSSNIKHQPIRHDLTATVAKLSHSGDLIWTAKFPTELIKSSRPSYASAATNWKPKQMRPWMPTTWRPFGHDCLVFSGDRILATFAEESSGISRRYLLDASSGETLSHSDWSAGGFTSPVNAGEFLVGDQGYGQFQTNLLAADGSCADHWDSHGFSFLHESKFLSIQMANTISQQQRCVEMIPGGEISILSDPLGGYYTTKPQQLADGHVYFWRNNRAWRWDLNDGVEPIIETDFGESAFGVSAKLSDERVAFNIMTSKERDHSKLLIIDI